MTPRNPHGLVFRCAVCGAEVVILATAVGRFAPRCCNQPMEPKTRRLVFYRCAICGAEVAVLKEGTGVFAPRCCNEPMQQESVAA